MLRDESVFLVRNPWNPVYGVIVVQLAEDGVRQLPALDLASLKFNGVVGRKKCPIAPLGCPNLEGYLNLP